MSVVTTLQGSDWFATHRDYARVRSGRGYMRDVRKRVEPLVEKLRAMGGTLLDLDEQPDLLAQRLAQMVNRIHEAEKAFVYSLDDLAEHVAEQPKVFLGTVQPLADLMLSHWADPSPELVAASKSAETRLSGIHATPDLEEAAEFSEEGELTAWLLSLNLDPEYVNRGVIFQIDPSGCALWNKQLRPYLHPDLVNQALLIKLGTDGIQSPLPMPMGYAKVAALIDWPGE